MVFTLFICLWMAAVVTPSTQANELHIWPIGWTPEMTEYIVERIVPEFQRKHPGVEVVITPHTWDGGEKLAIATAGGVAPDIVMTGATTVVSHVPRGLLQPIDRFLETWDNYHLVYPGAWDNAKWEGKTYSVPFTVDLRIVAYHQDIFSEVGLAPDQPLESWEEIEEAARLTTRVEGDTIVRRGTAFSTGTTAGMVQNFVHFLKQLGGQHISEDSRVPLYNTEEGREVLEFMKRVHDTTHPQGFGAPPSLGIPAFYAQQNAMHIAASYAVVRNMTRHNPTLLGQLGTFVPRRSPDSAPVSLAFLDGFGIPAGSKQPELAWDFIALMLEEDHARAFVEIQGYMMPRMDLVHWIQGNRPALIPWYEAMEHVITYPLIPGGGTLGSRIGQVLNGEVDAGIALEQAEREETAIFDQYWRDIERRAE